MAQVGSPEGPRILPGFSVNLLDQSDAQILIVGRLIGYERKQGTAALNNGLSTEENERLFTTAHLSEILALVLKGLIGIQS